VLQGKAVDFRTEEQKRVEAASAPTGRLTTFARCDGCHAHEYRASLKTLPGHAASLYCIRCRESIPAYSRPR
jgi:hypothetical protein